MALRAAPLRRPFSTVIASPARFALARNDGVFLLEILRANVTLKRYIGYEL